MDLILLPLLFAGMYLLLVRPQQKRLRAQRALIAGVAVGDEVVTAGGIIGTIRVLTDERLRLEVSPGVELEVLRAAISRTLDPATDRVVDPEEADAADDGPTPGDER